MKKLNPIPMSDVLAAFGTISNTAKVLGISHSAVSQWGEFVCKSRIYEMHVRLAQINHIEQSGTDNQ
tara:strand:+ start:358 stop:558 length:201 start_codon:yes stop_codon:yes gene_type:complete